MTSYPNCKINIGLNIESKRPDGYHDISTLMYPVPLCDKLTIEPSDVFSFSISGIKLEDDGKENLVVRAYRLIAKDYNIPNVSINLEKNIPSGAGLGGGSADAAFTIKMLNEMFTLNMSDEQMENYSSRLGADCAFFIKNEPMICEGIGNIMRKCDIQLNGKWLLLVKPAVHVSTAEAYCGCKPQKWAKGLRELLNEPIREWKKEIVNDFEKQVFSAHPELTQIKSRLYQAGADYAAMSGSGSSIFGIFSSDNIKDSFSEYNHYLLHL